jgi:hypothetical protein
VVTVADAVAAAGGVSAELKAANKALVERCKAQLSDADFAAFRQRSGAFVQGSVDAGSYHKQVVALGLLGLVPELAALCPDPAKRAALLEAHRQHLQAGSGAAPAAQGKGGGSLKGWVPPEAALAALAEAERRGSWACDRCTLINAPSSRACEVCSAPRPKGAPQQAAAGGSSSSSSSSKQAGAGSSSSSTATTWSAAAAARGSSSSNSGAGTPTKLQPAKQQQQQQPLASTQAAAANWPTLGGRPGGDSSSSANGMPAQAAAAAPSPQQPAADAGAAGGSSSSSGGKKKAKPAKQPLSELLAAGKSHPQNAWSQQQRLSGVTAPPVTSGTASMGQWKKSGGAKLAKKISAVNDALRRD